MNTCQGPACERPIEVKKHNLCYAHNQQRHAGKQLTELRPRRPRTSAECGMPGCTKGACSRGLCGPHASVAGRFHIEADDLVRLHEDRWCYGCSQRVDRIQIDHDHGCCNFNGSCGKCIRGTLCASCNTLLGRSRDKPSQANLQEYLSNAPHITFQEWKPRYKKS
jgi:hypothetical protein